MRSIISTFSALVIISGQAIAQAPAGGPPPGVKRVSGTVQSVSEGKMTVASEKGGTVEILVPADVPVARDVAATRAELAAAKIANCNATGESGSVLQATECHIIPADVKMLNSGHFPVSPGMTRTVGNVTSVKDDAAKSLELVIAYKDGEQHIAVPSSAKIAKQAPMELRQIKPGDEVVAASREVDGKTTALIMMVTQK